jgi:phosphate transport system substrate-binding protein
MLARTIWSVNRRSGLLLTDQKCRLRSVHHSEGGGSLLVHSDFAAQRLGLRVTLNRCGAALLAATALVLSACSDSNASSAAQDPGAVKVDCGGKKDLKASGSTAQANAMSRFVTAFEEACSGQTLNYTANGSGAGVREFIGGQTDFGGTDSPLSADEATEAKQRCGGADAWHLPVVFGPLAITYNLAERDTLVLDAPTIAKIFDGSITQWDDPAITRLNQSMPSQPIKVVYRSDESGTTDTFQRYLEAASDGAWTAGSGRTWKGGAGQGAEGNEGTSKLVNNTDGAISYNEWSFAQAQNLFWANIVTSGGTDPVNISPETVGKTIAGAQVSLAGNDLKLDTSSFYKPTEAGAYPIVLATYELVCSKYPDAETGKAVKAFLQSTIGGGKAGLVENGYIPLPEDFQSKVSTAVNAIS